MKSGEAASMLRQELPVQVNFCGERGSKKLYPTNLAWIEALGKEDQEIPALGPEVFRTVGAVRCIPGVRN